MVQADQYLRLQLIRTARQPEVGGDESHYPSGMRLKGRSDDKSATDLSESIYSLPDRTGSYAV